MRLCFRNVERKEGTTRSCINVVLGLLIQAMKEVLNDQPLGVGISYARLEWIFCKRTESPL